MSQPRLCCQVGWLCQNSFAQAAGRVTCHAGVWSCQSPLQSTPAIAFCVCTGILPSACRGTAPPPLQAWPRALFSTLLLFQRIRSHNSSPLPRLRLQAHRKLHGRGMRVPRKLTATKTSARLWCASPTYLNYFSARPPAWLISLEPLTTAVTSKFILKCVTGSDRGLFGTLHSITYTLGHLTNPVLLSGTLHLWFLF